MKYLVIITIVILVAPAIIFAQIGWTNHTVDLGLSGATSAYAIDLDRDNDVDILAAANMADSIVWYENDGNANFTKHTVADNFDGAQGVFAADFDGDGDVDVVGAAYSDGFKWWENDGASPPNFTEEHSISTFSGRSVYACDLDGDDDVDVLGAGTTIFSWWENIGTGNFIPHPIPSGFTNPGCIFAIDVDGDTDVDVLGSDSWFGDEIAWFENNGNESFTKQLVADGFNNSYSVYAIDIEPDGDVDIIGASSDLNNISRWKNDGNEIFTKADVDISCLSARSVFAIDLDDDEDVDILGTGALDGIAWYRNASGSFFEIPIILNNHATSVYAIDMDGDEDIDVLGASSADGGTIGWWESDLAYIDVGMVSIDIDSFVPENTKLLPQASVANLGNFSNSFNVTCEIEPNDYSSTAIITALGPGDSIQVTFPDTCLFETGSYTVMVYTQRVGDANPDNDTLVKVVTVDDTPPVSFGLISPLDSVMLSNPRPQFIWESSSDILSGLRDYEFYIDDILEHTGTDTIWTPDNDVQEGWHNWYVIAYDCIGNAQQSTEMWYFEIDTGIPDVPNLTAPIDGGWLSDTLVRFEWTEVTNFAYSDERLRRENIGRESDKTVRSQVNYIIQVDTLSDFASPVITDTVAETSTILLLFENFYYWRVKAFDLAGNQGPYAEPDSFGVDITVPVIESTTAWHDTSFAGPFAVRTKITDNFSGVDSALLYYKRDQDPEWVSIVMMKLSEEPDWFLELIPSVLNPDDTVRYYIEAADMSEPGNVAVDPESAPTEYYWFIANYNPGVMEHGDIPTSFSFGLRSNPARGKVVFNVALPHAAVIKLRIYDVAGRLIDIPASGQKPAGYHEISWSKDVSSGIFFYHLDSPWQQKIGKLVFLR